MASEGALEHDLERTGVQWRGLLKDSLDLPVLERAYQAVIILLLTSGLKGLAGIRTAEISRMSGVNESTLFRYIDKRDQLVADSVDWCWKRVNETIAAAHHKHPLVGAPAADLIMVDMEAVLRMYLDIESRLHGTGALLSFRRAEQLTAGFQAANQLIFRRRLESLTRSLLAQCGVSDSEPEVIATYLTNYLATVWFTWLADPKSAGPSGLLSIDMVLANLRSSVNNFSSCRFGVNNGSEWSAPDIERVERP